MVLPRQRRYTFVGLNIDYFLINTVQVQSELFDILSGESEVDHPLCEVSLFGHKCNGVMENTSDQYNQCSIIWNFCQIICQTKNPIFCNSAMYNNYVLR